MIILFNFKVKLLISESRRVYLTHFHLKQDLIFFFVGEKSALGFILAHDISFLYFCVIKGNVKAKSLIITIDSL